MSVYAAASAPAGVLRQGEILSDFTQYQIDVERLRAGEVVVVTVTHPHVIVLAQDCDLDQDFARRSQGVTDQLSAAILFCALDEAEVVRGDSDLNSSLWRLVVQNLNPRFHYLRAVPAEDDRAGQGLTALALDFKQYFAVPTAEAYYSVEHAVRRARLLSPYLEHLSARFAAYLGRVALPVDHHRELPPAGPAEPPPNGVS